MGQVNCRKHYLSLRKSLVLYVIAFVVLAVFLSVTTFSICGSAAEGIRASYPPSGEKYYLTNEAPKIEILILAIRKELGYKNKNIKQYDILKLYINDINKYL